MDFGDLEMLAEAEEQPKGPKAKAGRGQRSRAAAGRQGKAASRKPVDDDDAWPDLGPDGGAGRRPTAGGGYHQARTPTATKEETGATRPPDRQNPFGFGGADGLKKVPKKPEDDGEEWALDLDSRPTRNSGGARLLGRKPLRDDGDDELDCALDLLERKRGLESSKQAAEPPQQQRPKTAAVGKSLWGAPAELDELHDDDASRATDNASQRVEGPEPALAAQRRRQQQLFGGGQGGTASGDAPQRQPRASTAPRQRAQNQARPSGGSFNNDAQDQAEQHHFAEGNASIGSQGSGIEVIETAHSNKRRMIKPPAATASRPSLGAEASRPPAGQNANLNQIQELHQNNRLTRPDTANARKPPAGGSRAANEHLDDGGILLDLLDESQNAHSNAGSHVSGAQNRAGSQGLRKDQFAMSGSHPDFERADDDLDDDDEYGVEELDSQDEEGGADSDDDGGGSLYQPTLIAKTNKPAAKSKKRKKKRTAGNAHKTPDKGQSLLAPTPGGVQSMAGSGAGNFDFNDSARKANTFGSDQGGHTAKGKPGQQSFGGAPGQLPGAVGGASFQTSGPQQARTASNQNTMNSAGLQQIAMLEQPRSRARPSDPRGMLEYDVEQERIKLQGMEASYRQELEKLRKDHQDRVADVEKRHRQCKERHEAEKQAVIADKNNALEQEKKQLAQLNKIDIDNREMQYAKDRENQRALYEDQQQSLRKQLEERRHINELAQQITDSSGTINSLVAKIGAANEGELQRTQQEIERREKDVDEKRRSIAERKLHIEQRRRKLQQEMEDTRLRETETRLDYQREKSEITADLEKIEMEHLRGVGSIRDKVAECEVETKKLQSQREAVRRQRQREEQAHKSKMDEWQIEAKQIRQAHQDFRRDSESQVAQLRAKLQAVAEIWGEVLRAESAFEKEQAAFDDRHNRVVAENDALQEQLDKYCIEKEQFDRQAQEVKAQGQQDQIDSENIGYFKANKDRLYDELRQLRADLEAERQQLREEKVKLDIRKADLKTKQKTIESLRYNYIKGDQQSMVQKAEVVASAKGQFVPIRPPAAATESQKPGTTLVGSLQARSQANVSQAPRFNYEEYMQSLTEKISGHAPTASAQMGADFQAYLLRERESYLKSVHEFEKEAPLIQTLSRLRDLGTTSGAVRDDEQQTPGVNPLHDMSRGLSSGNYT